MIDWLALFAALFLVPGAIALGSMCVAIAAGGADVLTRERPRRLRQAAVFAAVGVTAAAWSLPIVWITARAMKAMPTFGWAWPVIGGIVAAAPTIALACKAGRGSEADAAFILPLGLPAVANVAAVVALLISR